MALFSIVKGTSYAPFTSQTVSAGAYVIDAVGFDNRTAGMISMDLQLLLSSVTPASGGTLAIYLISKIDGTNYPNPPGTTAQAPAPGTLVGSYAFTGAATTYLDIINMPMMLPYLNELVLWNNSGSSITITSSVAQPTTIQAV